MTTLSQMVEDVRAYLRSYTRDQELSTHLTAEASASALQLEVGDASTISRGRIEIDDELLWVDSVDRANNTITIAPYGRGMDSTTAAIHPVNTRIIVQPLYPKQMVKDTINQVIGGLGNQLYAVSTTTVSSSNNSVEYELPSNTERVLSVSVDYDTSYNDIEYLRRWKYDPQSSQFASGKALYVYEQMRTGATLTVTYFAKPTLLADGGDFDDSGLPDTSYDVIVLGSASRLMATSSSYLSSSRSIEANTLDGSMNGSQVLQQSRYLYTLYQARLDEEKTQLLNTYVTRAHYTG
jgi:hypothetical protein